MSRAHYFLVATVLVNDIDDSKIILVPGASIRNWEKSPGDVVAEK